MATSFFPFDAGAGSAITEAQWQKMARRWLNTGVIDDHLNELAVTADGSAMSVSVNTGGTWIRGFYFESDAAVALTIAAADATNPRIDSVVVRLDRTANTMELAVVTGTAASSPVAPTLSETDGLYELLLATVRVDAAVGVIAADKVTDGRTYAANLSTTAASAAYVAKVDNVGEGFRAYRSTAQTLTAATLTKVVFDVEQRDDGADYDPATGTWTVPDTGWYDVAAAVAFPSVAAGERTIVSVAIGGSESARLDDATAGSATSATRGGGVPMHLTAGQLVTVLAYRQNAGDVTAGSHLTWFTAKRRH